MNLLNGIIVIAGLGGMFLGGAIVSVWNDTLETQPPAISPQASTTTSTTSTTATSTATAEAAVSTTAIIRNTGLMADSPTPADIWESDAWLGITTISAASTTTTTSSTTTTIPAKDAGKFPSFLAAREEADEAIGKITTQQSVAGTLTANIANAELCAALKDVFLRYGDAHDYHAEQFGEMPFAEFYQLDATCANYKTF